MWFNWRTIWYLVFLIIMKKILIFGGYGFIGEKLYLSLKKIYNVKRYSSTKSKKIKYNYKSFFKIIKNTKPNIIFFLSGTSHPDYNNKNHIKDLKKTNLVIQDMLSALKNNNFKGKFFYFSTIGVYGSSLKKKVDENEKINPESFYTLSKEMAEKQCIFFSKNYKLNIIILRICSIFGPGLNRQIVYKIIYSLLSSSKTIKLLGNKTDKREFLFIDDLILILKKIIKINIKSGIFNIGSNKQYKIYDIINKLKVILRIDKKIFFFNEIKSPNFALLDNSKLNRIINIKRKFDINYGLNKTAQFYKKKIND